MAEENKVPESGTETGFKPIETQEAFDEMIKGRIERAQNSIRKEFEGFEAYKAKAESYDAKMEELNAALSAKETSIKELSEKVAAYESVSVKRDLAAEYHLAPGLVEFIKGADEKEWRESAEKLAKMTRIPDFKKDTSEQADDVSEDLRRISRDLRR